MSQKRIRKRVGDPVPPRRQRRFVSRAEFAAGSRATPVVDPGALRSDLDEVSAGEPDDPYAR